MASQMGQYGQGRCVNCGFLGKVGFDTEPPRAGSRLGDIEEALGTLREVGDLFNLQDGHPSLPHCYRGVPIFLEIIEPEPGRVAYMPDLRSLKNLNYMPKLREVLVKDRNCPLWTPWTEHWTPARHFEEFKMLQLEQERREHERRLEEERRQFQERLDTQRRTQELWMDATKRDFDLRLFEAGERLQNRTASLGHWLAFAAVILALAQIVAAAAGLTCDSLLWRILGLTLTNCLPR